MNPEEILITIEEATPVEAKAESAPPVGITTIILPIAEVPEQTDFAFLFLTSIL